MPTNITEGGIRLTNVIGKVDVYSLVYNKAMDDDARHEDAFQDHALKQENNIFASKAVLDLFLSRSNVSLGRNKFQYQK